MRGDAAYNIEAIGQERDALAKEVERLRVRVRVRERSLEECNRMRTFANWRLARLDPEVEELRDAVHSLTEKVSKADLLYIAVRSYWMAESSGRWTGVERAMEEYRDAGTTP